MKRSDTGGVAHFIGLNTWQREGVDVTINTDHMFGMDRDDAMNPCNPFVTMYAATTRRTNQVRYSAPGKPVRVRTRCG